MTMTRRAFLVSTASALAAPHMSRPAHAAAEGRELPIPALVETGETPVTLDAIAGRTPFLDGVETPSWGFSQAYLGPTLKFVRGRTSRMKVTNRLRSTITCHWHGLHVPAIVDGGPQLTIDPGATWEADLQIDQPASTLWYHSHAHGVTAEHVYAGLAGLVLVEDPEVEDSGLPNTYGVDDLPLVIQDRAFSEDGSLHYVKVGPALMHGFRADRIVVNGAISPRTSVPTGLVRLRLLNGSNARIYHLRFDDNRVFHRVASDGGLLPAPLATNLLTLAPAERVEVVVDFADQRAVKLLSGPDFNDPMGGMGGMMGGMLPGPPQQAEDGDEGEFVVMSFTPDPTRNARITSLPDHLVGAPQVEFGDPVRTRQFRLNMHAGMGGSGMGSRAMSRGGAMGMMAINDAAFDPSRIDVKMRLGETELWQVLADEMAHPFHVHGTSFQVLSNGGRAIPYEEAGLKDVVLVDGMAEILVACRHPAEAGVPYMYHCHILEHEDAGMMGQFTVG